MGAAGHSREEWLMAKRSRPKAAKPAPSPPITRAQGRRIMALMSRISRQIDRLARR